MNDFSNITDKIAEQIPKGGAWLTLKNIQLALNIVFDTIWETIKLAICLAGIYYLYTITPELQTFIATISK